MIKNILLKLNFLFLFLSVKKVRNILDIDYAALYFNQYCLNSLVDKH